MSANDTESALTRLAAVTENEAKSLSHIDSKLVWQCLTNVLAVAVRQNVALREAGEDEQADHFERMLADAGILAAD